MRRALPFFFIIALVLAACASTGGDEPVTEQPTTDEGPAADGVLVIQPGATASGPGISIAEALDHVGGEPVLVNGSLFIDPDGGVLLCDAIAESFPPQCGGVRLEVRGLDPAGQLLEEANGVRWAESVQLLGRIEAGG